MIRVYPSRHPMNVYPSTTGHPVERCATLPGETIMGWAQRHIAPRVAYHAVQPITVDVNGQRVLPADWPNWVLQPDDDVRVYPQPQGIEIGAGFIAWVAAGIAAAALIYALTLSVDAGDTSNAASGDSLDFNPAKANGVRLYEPIREILGRAKIYPDYVTQPVTRFVGPRDVRTTMLLCIGKGRYSILPSDMKVGTTPFSAFGGDVSYALYEPGQYLGSDPRSENWFLCPEVGSSKSATAGLDLDSPLTITAVSADAVTLSGASVSVVGDSASIPDSWVAGTIVTLETPNTYSLSQGGSYTLVAGDLTEFAPFVGMLATVSTPAADLDLVVAIVNPYVPPTPGTGGSASMVTASAAPSTYDFTLAPVTWNLTYRGVTRSLTLNGNYVNMSGLVSQITNALNGMGLVAQDQSGRVRITEPSSPFQGGAITQSGAPVTVFGSSPVYVTGTASSGGSPGQQASVGFNFPDGTPVSGLGSGLQRMALGVRGFRYRISSVDGVTMQVQRLTSSGTVDGSWPGFSARTIIDFTLNSEASGANWIGPFFVCPDGEVVDRIEWDIYFPGGLFHTDKKGNQIEYGSRVVVQYADVLTGSWVTIQKTYRNNTKDAFGVTESVNLATPIRPMLRMRREEFRNWPNSQDNTQWFAMRGRLLERATSYANVTTLAVTVRTGSRLSAQSDRKINVIATRLYEEGQARSIGSAIRYVCQSIGASVNDVDLETFDELQAQFWGPRGETFDQDFTEQESAIDIIRMILTAGMSHPVIDDSRLSAVREGVQPIMRMMTPQDTTSELRVAFKAPSVDDYGGVDVKYTDPVTLEIETVRCRLPDVAPIRVEEYTLKGVQGKVRAWVIGMRRLMKHRYQRLTAQTSTEMDALAYQFLDHVVMTSDIPGDQTQSMLIRNVGTQGGRDLLLLSERPDWSFREPRVIIRRQDGTVTGLLVPERTGERSLSLPAGSIDWQINWDIDEPVLLFCSSQSVGYSMMIDSIEPDGDGMCDVSGVEYSDALYRWDNSTPDANGYPSEI